MRRGIGRLRARASGFNPASLFLSGEQGGWYDPSDLTSMFQDTAGTTPAVVNSAVARINDKSGRANHLTQATGASQAILRNSGSLYWLEPDGLDDFYTTPSYSLAATAAMVAAIRNTNDLAAGIGNVYDAASGVRQILGTTGGSTWRIFAGASLTSGAIRDANDHVLVGNFAGASSSLEVDKSSVASGNAGTNVNATGMILFAAAGVLQVFSGRFYGGVVIARALTAAEKSGLYTYLGAKAGLSL